MKSRRELERATEPVLRRPMSSALGGVPNWAVGADLWFDFVQNLGTLPAVTDTHGQTIMVLDAAGVYTPKTTNVLCRSDLGLLTVPTRTNSIRNNSMTGAAVGTPGTLPTNWATGGDAGLTYTVTDLGTRNGLPYIRIRVAGLTVGTAGALIQFENTTTIAALTGQLWTESASISLVGGTFANVTGARLAVSERTAAGALISNRNGPDILGSISETPTRFSAPVTLSGGATTAFVSPRLEFTAGAAALIDFEIELAAPQLEGTSVIFASPPILTTNAAVTVNGNIPITTGLGVNLAGGFTGLLKGTALQAGASSMRYVSFDDGTADNRVQLLPTATIAQMLTTKATISQGSVTLLATQPQPGPFTLVFSAGPQFMTGRLLGQAQSSVDTSVDWPALDRVDFGNFGVGASGNHYQFSEKIVLKAGASQQIFDEVYALALLA